MRLLCEGRPVGLGARRLVRHTARFNPGLRHSHHDAGGPQLHHGRLGITIVRAASFNSGPMRAIGAVIHCARQLATAEARIVGPDGKIYAHGTTTCLVFEAPALK